MHSSRTFQVRNAVPSQLEAAATLLVTAHCLLLTTYYQAYGSDQFKTIFPDCPLLVKAKASS
jgi:hypothetical protein